MEAKVEPNNGLPPVLEEEVQLRLPAKSLVRFKSVCKQWRSRFESRPFIDLYAQRRPRGPFNSFSSGSRTSDGQELLAMLPGLDSTHEGFMIGHGGYNWFFRPYGPLSNGIYCVTSYAMMRSNGTCPVLSAKIALCNPATRQHEFAKPFPYELRPMLSETSQISPLDSTLPPSRLFFGFGSVCKVNDGSETLDYRVIVIIHYGTKMPYSFLVFVYSFLKRKWRQIVDYRAGRKKIGKPKALAGFDLPQGRRIIGILDPFDSCPLGFLKGCYHWVVIHQDHSFSVLTFNFADQSFKLLGVPLNPMDVVVDDEGVQVTETTGECIRSLVLHDHLALIRYFTASSMQMVEIGVWMMMEYGVEQSWTRIHSINPDFNCVLNEIQGIDYEEDPCANEGGGGIHIKGLLLQVGPVDGMQEIVYFDSNGGHQVIASVGTSKPLFLHRREDGLVMSARSLVGGKFCFRWNTPGVSTYIESLEPLCTPDVSSETSDKIGTRHGGRFMRLLREAITILRRAYHI